MTFLNRIYDNSKSGKKIDGYSPASILCYMISYCFISLRKLSRPLNRSQARVAKGAIFPSPLIDYIDLRIKINKKIISVGK